MDGHDIIVSLILLLILAASTCMFVLANDIHDMREELGLLNKRSDQDAYGDIAHLPDGLTHSLGVTHDDQ